MNKKNLYLLGVFAVLVLSAYLIQGPLSDLQEKLSKTKNFLSELDVDSISYIDISSSDNALSLEKQGDKWLISGTKEFYVDDENIQSALNSLKNAQTAELEIVSNNPDKKSEFETTLATGKFLKFRQGEEVLMEFVLGKTSGDFISSYISQIDRDETYLVKVNLANQWNRDDWYNTTIFAIELEGYFSL